MDSWEDRRFFLGFANEKDLQTLTDPETRVSRVPLFYTCFLRVLQGSTGKTGVLAENPVFQAGNRVCGLENVPARCENHAWGFVTARCVGCVAFATLRTHSYVHTGYVVLHALRSLCRDRYIQSATNRAVALRWLCSVGYVRCVPIVSYTSVALRCVRCVAFVAYRSLRTHRLHCVGCVAFGALRCFRVFGSRRYVPNGCVASVAFVPFTSFRSERNDVNARNVSHRLRWLACVRCKPFIHQPHQPVSVKDCQKKLNSLTLGVKVFKVASTPHTHPHPL